jgi:hypothetical protein
MTPLDAETRSYLQASVARELHLASHLASRIGGDDISSMRADGAELAKALGIAPPADERARDDAGRFSGSSSGHEALNHALRRAAGRA